jgi:hypothetical protein
VFEVLKDKGRLSAQLDSANETIAAQSEELVAKKQEIEKLLDAVKARSDCIKELCGCLDDAAQWIDPIMIGPVTATGTAARDKLLERMDAALTWAGHRKIQREGTVSQVRRAG